MQNTGSVNSNKVKCWIVREEDEGSCEVVFHSHGLAARRLGINAHGGCDGDDGYVVSRCNEWDCYAEKGFVPIKAMLDAGWWVHTVTGIRISLDDLEDEGFDFENLVFTQDEKGVFHDMDECHEHALEINGRNHKFTCFKNAISKSWPELNFIKWQGGYPWITFSVTFTFPDAKYGGSFHWDSDKPEESAELRIAFGDTELWKEFYNSIRPQEVSAEFERMEAK